MPEFTEDEELRRVIEKTFPLVVSALLSQYQLPREDAARLQQELFEWFDRLARRPGSPKSVSSLRLQLISMTCKVGHMYWIGRLGAELPRDETLKRALSLGPDVIAIEVEERIRRPNMEKDG